MSRSFASVLYNLLLSLWLGGMYMYTFLVTPVIFRTYSRDMAAEIVGKLFPVYFPYNLIVCGLALVAALAAAANWDRKRRKIVLLMISAALVINTFLTFGLYPEIVRVKQQIASFETVPVEAPLRQKFKQMHGLSMVLNILLLADSAALIYLNSFKKKHEDSNSHFFNYL